MARGDRGEEIFRDDRDRWKFLGYHAGYAELQKMKSFLDSEPIQGVFESYSGRCWKVGSIVAGWKRG